MKIAFNVVAVLHFRFAGVINVDIAAIRRDLYNVITTASADGAKVDSGLPDRIGPTREQRLGLLRFGIGGKVQVVAQASEQGIAHRAADQRQSVAGGFKALRERAGHLLVAG